MQKEFIMYDKGDMNMIKRLFALLVVVCVGLFSMSFASSTNSVSDDGFLSPLASHSLLKTGDINTTVDVVTVSNNTENGVETIAYGRSTGCSTGCSMGCSTGCSTGCSMGCGGW